MPLSLRTTQNGTQQSQACKPTKKKHDVWAIVQRARVGSAGPLLYQGADALRLGEKGHHWARSCALWLKNPR